MDLFYINNFENPCYLLTKEIIKEDINLEVHALPNFSLVIFYFSCTCKVKIDVLQWMEYHISFFVCELSLMGSSL